MDLRQRFINTLLFRLSDKTFFSPGKPRESTLARWSREGLSENTDYFQFLCEKLHIDISQHKPIVEPGISFQMIPQFEEKILEHKNGHYIVQDWSGGIVEISDKYDYTYLKVSKDFVTRKWHKFPVQSRDDWDAMKKRYNVKTPNRFPEDFKKRCIQLKERDYPLTIELNGPFWQLREWCGMENLCLLMIDQPDFVEEMASFWTKFISEMLDEMLCYLCPDCIFVREDMAYKGASIISPKMVYRFIMPSYQQWIPKLKEKGCPIIEMDSDGYVGELLPIWVEAGFNCCFPVEVAAGNDILEYRRLYGKRMAYIGGIDKRAIAKGGKTMEQEVMRVEPVLKDGGFIPGCDHGVPPDISWPNFIEFSRLLAKLSGW